MQSAVQAALDALLSQPQLVAAGMEIAAAAAFYKAVWPHASRLCASTADLSALSHGAVPRRWLLENLLAIVACFASGAQLYVAGKEVVRADAPFTAARAASLASAVARFGVSVVAAVAARVFGSYTDLRADVPRNQALPFMRPRWQWFRMRLAARMSPLRVWWAVMGALSAATIVIQARGGLTAGSAAVLATAGAATPGAPATPSQLLAAGAAAFASHYSSALTAPGAVAALVLNATLSILAALAIFSLCKWSAADFSGFVPPGAGHLTHWLWPTGQSGETPHQTAPPRMLHPPYQSPARAMQDAAATPAGSGGAPRRPWLYPAPADSSPWDSSPDASPAEVGSGRGVGAAAQLRDRVALTAYRSPEASAAGANDAEGAGSSAFDALPPPLLIAGDTIAGHPSPSQHVRRRRSVDGGAAAGLPLHTPSPAARGPVVSLLDPPPPGHRYQPSPTFLPPRRLRIVILTIGTRGDVQPFVALGCSLKEAGHSVVISSTDEFKGFVTGAGLEFAPTGVPAIHQPPEWLTITSVADMIRATGSSMAADYPRVAAGFYAAVTTPAPADVIIGTAMTVTFALNISEGTGIPAWIAKLAPDILSAGSVMPGTASSKIGWVNLLTGLKYWLGVAKATEDVGVAELEATFRRNLMGLPPAKASERIEAMSYTPQLLGFSKHLFPKPADYPTWAFQCGFWMLPSSEGDVKALPPQLRSFVECIPEGSTGESDDDEDEEEDAGARRRAARAAAPGPQPWDRVRLAIVTFGSMINASRPTLISDITTECRNAGYKVLVLTGWSDRHPAGVPLPEADPYVLCAREAPHDWLFSHAALVVHHGGAGTTGRALASGIPSIILPVLRFADQMQWGGWVDDLGLGTVIREANPSRAAIAAAIAKVTAPRVAGPSSNLDTDISRANRVGAFVRAEGAAEAAQLALDACLCNLVLTPAEADAIHPQAGPLPPPEALTPAQRMCARHCIPCRLMRTRVQPGALAQLTPGVVSHVAPRGAAAASATAAAATLPSDVALSSSDRVGTPLQRSSGLVTFALPEEDEPESATKRFVTASAGRTPYARRTDAERKLDDAEDEAAIAAIASPAAATKASPVPKPLRFSPAAAAAPSPAAAAASPRGGVAAAVAAASPRGATGGAGALPSPPASTSSLRNRRSAASTPASAAKASPKASAAAAAAAAEDSSSSSSPQPARRSSRSTRGRRSASPELVTATRPTTGTRRASSRASSSKASSSTGSRSRK